MFEQIDLNNCYQYSITLCGVTYTVPMYLITGKGGNYFTMNQPNDPSNSECIDAITWGLYFYYIPDFVEIGIDAWVLYDGDELPLAYIESTDPENLPSEPFSEWTIVEGSDGALINDFSVSQIECAPFACDCMLIVSLEIASGAGFVFSGEPLGTFNGRTIFKVDGNITTGELAIYWSYMQNRWNIDYWGNQYTYPEPEPPAYIISEADCPSGEYLNNPLYVTNPDSITSVNVFTTNCGGENDNYEYPPITDYCCAIISFIGSPNVVQFNLSLSIQTWVDYGSVPTYTFEVDSTNIAIVYNGANASWEMYDVTATPIMIAFSLPGVLTDTCPSSDINSWFVTSDGYEFISKVDMSDPDQLCESFAIIQYDCPEVILPGDHDAIDCEPFQPCYNKQTLKRSSASLSKDIASISKREVFGFNCEDAWNNIFMRNSIIHALSCLPYGYYSEADEQCLISKLNDKCDC